MELAISPICARRRNARDRPRSRAQPLAFQRASSSAAQRAISRVALEHFEARVDELDAIEYRLQLGRLVDDVNRRGDLAAIVQQPGDLQLVAVACPSS